MQELQWKRIEKRKEERKKERKVKRKVKRIEREEKRRSGKRITGRHLPLRSEIILNTPFPLS
jgi:hypothetical protein